MRRLVLAVVLVLVGSSIGACGSSGSPAKSTRTVDLDTLFNTLDSVGVSHHLRRQCGEWSSACHAIVVGRGDSTKLVYVESGPVLQVQPPRPVARAGGRELAEFEGGRVVLLQSGCLACHRIGTAGNAGPGQDLSQVGTRLAPAAIERAILDATAPMPSFSGLPKPKLRALVAFLSLMR